MTRSGGYEPINDVVFLYQVDPVITAPSSQSDNRDHPDIICCKGLLKWKKRNKLLLFFSSIIFVILLTFFSLSFNNHQYKNGGYINNSTKEGDLITEDDTCN